MLYKRSYVTHIHTYHTYTWCVRVCYIMYHHFINLLYLLCICCDARLFTYGLTKKTIYKYLFIYIYIVCNSVSFPFKNRTKLNITCPSKCAVLSGHIRIIVVNIIAEMNELNVMAMYVCMHI